MNYVIANGLEHYIPAANFKAKPFNPEKHSKNHLKIRMKPF